MIATQELIDILHQKSCSCVIYSGGEIHTFFKRGVTDIFGLLKRESHILRGAVIADKVIGRAAAAILIEGGVKQIYADVISLTALELLEGSNIELSYAETIECIPNRKGDDMCPMERACKECITAQQAVEVLDGWRFPDGSRILNEE